MLRLIHADAAAYKHKHKVLLIYMQMCVSGDKTYIYNASIVRKICTKIEKYYKWGAAVYLLIRLILTD